MGDELSAWNQLSTFYKHGLGYAQEMAGRPQTLYALTDSPIGLAAWMLDHDEKSYELIACVFDGQTEGLTKQDVVRQHHALLADQHCGVVRAALLGEQAGFLRAERRAAADRRGALFRTKSTPPRAVGPKRPIPS